MANTENTLSSKFHAFLKQRNSKTNDSIQGAQRLVNLYRVLGAFGSDFVDQYNEMLLNSSDDVQMSLNALVGGQEVRQYLDFLRQEQHIHDNEETPDKKSMQTGWLPSPEEEQSSQTPASSSNKEWMSMMKAEEEKLNKMIASLREEQELALKRLSAQLSSTLQVRTDKTPPPKPSETNYSEIIEEKK